MKHWGQVIWAIRGVAIALCLGLLLGGILACDSSEGGEGDHASQAVKAFPLSAELPSDEFVKLQGAIEGQKRTATFLYNVEGRDRICVVILVAAPGPGGDVSVLGGTPSCKGAEQQSRRLTAALGLNDPEMRLLSFVFGPSVDRIELTHPGGGKKIVQTNDLTGSQVSDLGIHGDLTYAVVRDVPPCFELLKTLRANGSTIGGTALAPC